jgi:hypothetical protein
MSETGTEALVGLCAEPGCGAVVMCSVLEADRPKRDIANFAADAVRRGYRLETWSVERTRAATWDCAHTEAKRAARRKSAAPQLELAEPAR